LPGMEFIRNRVAAMPEGRPFATGSLLRLGGRAAVDKALQRLAVDGAIMRVARGIYVRPRLSPYAGKVKPQPQEVAQAAAEAMGATIAQHGATWALALGLTQQVALIPTFLTDGSTRHLRAGRMTITLRRTTPRRMRLAGFRAGGAVLALEWLGKHENPSATLAKIREALGEAEFSQFMEEAKGFGGWIAKVADAFERQARRP